MKLEKHKKQKINRTRKIEKAKSGKEKGKRRGQKPIRE